MLNGGEGRYIVKDNKLGTRCMYNNVVLYLKKENAKRVVSIYWRVRQRVRRMKRSYLLPHSPLVQCYSHPLQRKVYMNVVSVVSSLHNFSCKALVIQNFNSSCLKILTVRN